MYRSYLGLIAIIGLTTGAALASDSPQSAGNSRIATLIAQLGSSRFNEREKAGRELENIGEPVLPALRQAAKSSDLETSRRAKDLLRKVEERVVTARILAPKRLRLKLKDATVSEAVKQLEKESGYKLHIHGNPDDRRITLDTGETTFWQALDQLCVNAGLREMQSTMPMPGRPGQMPLMPVQPALPGGILPVVPPPAAPKKAPVLQIQAAAQLQPLPIQPPPLPFPGNFGSSGMPMMNGNIILTPGKTPLPPTCYAGSVRIRLASRTRSRPGELSLGLDVAAEPRVLNLTLDGSPRVDKAIGDGDRKLEPIAARQQPGAMPGTPPMPMAAMWASNPMTAMMGVRHAFVRLKLDEAEVKSLKELSGVLTAKALSATEPLITVEDVLNAAGKTVKGAHGGSIQVQAIDKLENGDYQMKMRLEGLGGFPGMMMMPGGPAGGPMQMQIRIGGTALFPGSSPLANRMPVLVDKNGTPYRITSMPAMRMSVTNGQMSQEVTLVLRAGNGQGPPDRLVHSGQRVVDFSVPFRFTNVPF
jgi:hypothetical protein